MNRPFPLLALAGLLLLGTTPSALAEHLLMVRSPQAFPEAMMALQNTIGEHGYTVSRVQRVDIGLTSSGFKTDRYRVVFFGKAKEQRELVSRHPQLIPYLPLQMTIFAEEDETIISSADPTQLHELVPDEQVGDLFMRWRNDILSIMEELRQAE